MAMVSGSPYYGADIFVIIFLISCDVCTFFKNNMTKEGCCRALIVAQGHKPSCRTP